MEQYFDWLQCTSSSLGKRIWSLVVLLVQQRLLLLQGSVPEQRSQVLYESEDLWRCLRAQTCAFMGLLCVAVHHITKWLAIGKWLTRSRLDAIIARLVKVGAANRGLFDALLELIMIEEVSKKCLSRSRQTKVCGNMKCREVLRD